MRFPLILLASVLALMGAAGAARAAEYVPGEVIVHYEDGTRASVRADVQAESGIGRSRKLPGGSRRLQIVDGESVPETLAELRDQPGVAYAVPNYVARAGQFLPNDPGDGTLGEWAQIQWNFSGPASVNAPRAWEIARQARVDGGRGVTVAVLDTGVAYASRGPFRRAPDLHAKRFVRGYDFVDDDPYPNDENGHGTHVTGTIAQRTNNAVGVTGLAYGVRIMPLRVLDFQGAGDAGSISRAIRYAARNGAHVINMSLEFDAGVTAAEIPDIVRAVEYAHRKGAVITAASGNEGSRRVAYPARTRHVISVGGTTINSCQAEYSNSGRGLDLVAPGGGTDAANSDNPRDAASCRPETDGPDIYQQTFTRNVRTFGLPPGYQGTSMASAHVAAAAALVIATRRLGRRPSPARVERRLEQTARDLGFDGYDARYGSGLLDAAAAIEPPAAPVGGVSPTR